MGVNNMGCCEWKNVPGSMPKSGDYFLDTQYMDTVPAFCKDSCVYVKEKGPGEASTGDTKFCFKQSSTYTAECQDTGDSNIAIDSNIVIDSPESKPSDPTDIVMDSPEMKPESESDYYYSDEFYYYYSPDLK